MNKFKEALSQPEPLDDEPQRRRADKPDSKDKSAHSFDGELAPQAGGQPTVANDPSWQAVIWGEWRNTADEEYARHLFNLVADEPAGNQALIINVALGVIYGGLTGLLFGLLATMGSAVSFASVLLPAVGLWAMVGGLAGFFMRQVEKQISWKVWLSRLTFDMAPNELGLIGVGLVFALFGSQVGWMLGWSAKLGRVIEIVTLTVLLAGSLGVRLVGWMVEFGRKPNPNYLHQYRNLWFWWKKRPSTTELGAALNQALARHPDQKKVWRKALNRLAQQQARPADLDDLLLQLQSQDWSDRFSAAQLLVTVGGEAVFLLQELANRRSSPQHRSAIRLLRNIGQETATRLADRTTEILCPTCFARFDSHTITVSGNEKVTFYGCRLCHQSNNFWEGRIVAVLDAGMKREVKRTKTIRINWLTRRKLFDFDDVEIIQAGDEDVERFVVQVGNDTDSFRLLLTRKATCRIGPTCHLSENTLRILRRAFRQVTVTA